MDENTINAELLGFFKALADANRLKIVGLLAQKPHAVEEIAELLEIGVSTASHHLSRLAKAGLIEARPQGHYFFYSLRVDLLKEMSQRLLNDDNLRSLSQQSDSIGYDKKILKSFTDKDGWITAFPAQEKKFLVLLRHVLGAFTPGRRYSEFEVNEILAHYNEDTALLRRSLVDYKYMERQGGGGEYWRTE